MYLHQILEIMKKFKLKRIKIKDGMLVGVTWKGETLVWLPGTGTEIDNIPMRRF